MDLTLYVRSTLVLFNERMSVKESVKNSVTNTTSSSKHEKGVGNIKQYNNFNLKLRFLIKKKKPEELTLKNLQNEEYKNNILAKKKKYKNNIPQPGVEPGIHNSEFALCATVEVVIWFRQSFIYLV